MKIGILLTRGKHFHDRIISVRGKIKAHIEVPVSRQVSERWRRYVKGIDFAYISTICSTWF